MPIYDYVCANCSTRTEFIHGIDAAAPRFCPACGAEGTLRKAIVPPAVHFKGSGWAKKDRSSSARARAKEGAGEAGAARDAAGDGSKGGSADGSGAGSGSSPSGADAPSGSATGSTRVSTTGSTTTTTAAGEG